MTLPRTIDGMSDPGDATDDNPPSIEQAERLQPDTMSHLATGQRGIAPKWQHQPAKFGYAGQSIGIAAASSGSMQRVEHEVGGDHTGTAHHRDHEAPS
ncbi:hypothetical protein LGM75_16735 [Burkholderia multivorans]|uniref:hypothetical protein n=1 Tax=Burkholderia multivorans TaxID=87883 RepID=UPI001C245366|nr:hypothetical protein [Burkholderia multivorans]MBU9364700.1 hypothetical protein [Burkholderia multivorans]MBU9466928.1 hypothetical protein [Burkholderia multivorans]MCA8127997.1 hypothetical protein [Burkholderia multivorans]MCA8412010.1 hypothetical protein [Burkholderia multivorans]MDI3304863.1 hypothetical protein [Burkholderia multivorans]